MAQLKIKICGITRASDAWAAVEAGADAIGFMFVEGSPRRISVADAEAISRSLPPFLTRVGVVADPSPERVREILDRSGVGVLQFHGNETPEFCSRFAPVPAIKAFRLESRQTLETLPRYETGAWLLDAFVPGQLGGTGVTFNWEWAIQAKELGRPVLLAGGLTPENIAEAVLQVAPYGVDVSSGVEVRPGVKDPLKIQAFVAAARSAASEIGARAA